MREISVAAAAQQLPRLMADVASENVMLTTEKGPVAVLVSFSEFQALQIARSLARDPDALAAIRSAYDRAQAEQFEDFEPLSHVLEHLTR